MADFGTWDRSIPSDTSQVRDFASLHRSDKSLLEETLQEEHYFESSSSLSAGIHKPGSALPYSGLSSQISTVARIGYRPMYVTDTGRMHFLSSASTLALKVDPSDILQSSATTNNAIIWNGTTWTPGSTAPAYAAIVDTSAVLDEVQDLSALGDAGTVMRVDAAGTGLEFAGGLTQIAETALAADAASITFSSIPSVYRNLLVIAYWRSTAAVTRDTVTVQFNASSAASYDYQIHRANDGTVLPDGTGGATAGLIAEITGASGTATVFSQAEIKIANYANSNFQKLALSHSATKWAESATGVQIASHAVFWRNSSAVTQLTFATTSSFLSGTVVTLYGIK